MDMGEVDQRYVPWASESTRGRNRGVCTINFDTASNQRRRKIPDDL
jgi:hypothetical protein